MTNDFKTKIKSIARGLKTQSRNKKVKVFLGYLYTSDVITRYLEMFLTYKKITRAGFSILHTLILEGGSMIPTMLSKKTGRSKYSVTRVVDTLEKMGLVQRISTGTDRRLRKVIITDEGLETVKTATLSSRQRLCEEIFQTLDENRIEELDSLLKEVRNNVKNLTNKIALEGDPDKSSASPPELNIRGPDYKKP
jgi:DNA-binding MarR family transcriptional regulator